MNIVKWAAIALAGSLALSAGAAAAAPDQAKKEYVCHYTASAKNPVVIINVGNKAVGPHKANHQLDVHQGSDSSSDTPPTDCAGGGEE